MVVGFCGINCDECDAYQTTVKGDLAALEKIAAKYWNGKYSPQDWACLGCLPANQAFLAKYCSDCKIRVCAIQKGVQNCAACGQFDGCDTVQEFIKNEGEQVVRMMKLLRERFLDEQGKAAS